MKESSSVPSWYEVEPLKKLYYPLEAETYINRAGNIYSVTTYSFLKIIFKSSILNAAGYHRQIDEHVNVSRPFKFIIQLPSSNSTPYILSY